MTFAAGVIAAGEGSRLSKSHPGVVKPLVPVAGRPLVHRVVSGLEGAGCREIVLLTNSRGRAVPESLSSAFPRLRFDFQTADTASSFESFRLVSQRLAERHHDFLVSTVDSLIPSADTARFWSECRATEAAAGLALTSHVDDENPLWVDCDERGFVTAVGEGTTSRSRVACGLYYMTQATAKRLPAATAHARLRDFWRSLAAETRIAGPTLSKTLDVDRPEDVVAAEEFLSLEAES